MNFNAPVFLLFCPLVCLVHWLLPHKLRWVWLLLSSWVFYFYWNPWTGLLLIGITLVSWLCGRGIAKTESRAGRRALLVLACVVSLGCLAIFKYTGFLAELVGLHLALQILLPAGISFYTFQTLSYVIDVYRGTIAPEKHFGYYALFVSFFPQLVAGPIERPEHLLPQLRKERTFSRENLTAGGWLLLEGYCKKILLADGLAPYVDRVFANPALAAGPETILATVLFGLQIYCDFSGYSSIARGTARILGIDLMENFKRPYEARTIREFWRRWHISLTGWFTDYVYIPLGGSRRGTVRQIRNILIVFFLSGLWHGAGWNFVAWGMLHGLYQACSVLWAKARPAGKEQKQPGIGSAVRTYLLVSIPWLFFRAPTMGDAVTMLSRLGTGWAALPQTVSSFLPALLPVLCLPLIEHMQDRKPREASASALAVFCCVVAVSLAWLAQQAGGGPNAFLYFQF